MHALPRTNNRRLSYLTLRAGRITGLRALMDLLASPEMQRLLRFGIVGASGVLVNTAVLYFLVEAGHVSHLMAAAAGSEVSILSNFVLNERWTFHDARPTSSPLRRAVQYNAVTLGGMVLSLGVLAVLMAALNLHYLIANLIAIGAATVSNYAINSRFTWATNVRRQMSPANVSP